MCIVSYFFILKIVPRHPCKLLANAIQIDCSIYEGAWCRSIKSGGAKCGGAKCGHAKYEGATCGAQSVGAQSKYNCYCIQVIVYNLLYTITSYCI